jgi:Zn-dependent protease
MNLSWKIFTAFKIPVRLHISMVVIPFVAFTWVTDSGPWGIVTSMGLVVLLFGSVLLHELGHALTARRFGVQTKDIILTPIGGMARIVNMPRSPVREILIALAGPVVSLAIATVAFMFTVAFVVVPIAPEVVQTGFSTLFTLNLMLGLFNLVPALPMDGGRILRGVLAIKRDYLSATILAARIGKIIAVIGGLAGVFYLKSWSLGLIALFIFFSAGQEVRMAAMWAAKRREEPFANPGPFARDPEPRRPRRNPRPGPQPNPRVVIIQGGKAEVISRKDPK